MEGGLSPRRLQYFFEAVTTGSVRGAAERLGVEPLHRQPPIQLLETELGVTLLNAKAAASSPPEIAAIVMDHARDRRAEAAAGADGLADEDERSAAATSSLSPAKASSIS
ncbi:helix-turn-helix domain-containing protein [Cupriavidus basilensis]